MDCWYIKNPLNLGFCTIQNGQMAVILDFCYKILNIVFRAVHK